jgi:hypothetical protein
MKESKESAVLEVKGFANSVSFDDKEIEISGNLK